MYIFLGVQEPQLKNGSPTVKGKKTVSKLSDSFSSRNIYKKQKSNYSLSTLKSSSRKRRFIKDIRECN